MVAAGRIEIDLLKQDKIRLERTDFSCSGRNARYHAFRAFCPRLRAAVHKEGIIIGVCAKADILCRNGVFHAHACGKSGLLRVARLQGLIIGDTIIAEHDIAHIDNNCRHQYGKHNQQNLQQLSHL